MAKARANTADEAANTGSEREFFIIALLDNIKYMHYEDQGTLERSNGPFDRILPTHIAR